MRRRPVVLVGWDDDDVAVQAHLLAVVLTDVRVVPVDTGVGKFQAVAERAADRHRRLSLVGAVVAIVQAKPVPVHGRFEVAVVFDVDDQLRPLADTQCRSGNRTAVGEHPHLLVADLLGDGADAKLGRVAVCKVDDPRRGCLREPLGAGRESVAVLGVAVMMLHSLDPLARRRRCPTGRRYLSWFVVGGDLLGDEPGVVLDPAKQRRPARVLPG